jgi:hypothetical protein
MGNYKEMLNMAQAIANGNEAMRRSEHSAESECPGWSEAAYLCVTMFPKEEFLVEEPREWAYSMGLHKPFEQRCWGQVIKNLIRDGVLIPNGFGRRQHIEGHGDMTNKWKKRMTGDEWYGTKPPIPLHTLADGDDTKIRKKVNKKIFRVRNEAIMAGVSVDITVDSPYTENIIVTVWCTKEGKRESFYTIIEQREKTTLGEALDYSLKRLFPKPEPKAIKRRKRKGVKLPELINLD